MENSVPVYRYLSGKKNDESQWGWPSKEQQDLTGRLMNDIYQSKLNEIYSTNYHVGHNLLLYFTRSLNTEEERILDDILIVKYKAVKAVME